jgi:hypothetical protein
VVLGVYVSATEAVFAHARVAAALNVHVICSYLSVVPR